MLHKVAIGILSALLIPLQISLWGDGGWLQLNHVRESLAAQRTENEQLKRRNRQLTHKVYDLKAGSAAIEEIARVELGMMKKNETFFRLIKRPLPAENSTQDQ